MTNLEWINEQIEECDEMIEHLKIKKDKYSKNKSLVETYNKHIKNLTGVKQHFEQIKSELEAWEIVKNKNVKVSKVKSSPNFQVYDSLFNSDEIEKYRITEIEYDTIIKTLEVKE